MLNGDRIFSESEGRKERNSLFFLSSKTSVNLPESPKAFSMAEWHTKPTDYSSEKIASLVRDRTLVLRVMNPRSIRMRYLDTVHGRN